MEGREATPCPNCGGRRIEWDGHGVFHATNGHQMCPERTDHKRVMEIVANIAERDADLLKRLADS
jgi:hypothetical protein